MRWNDALRQFAETADPSAPYRLIADIATSVGSRLGAFRVGRFHDAAIEVQDVAQELFLKFHRHGVFSTWLIERRSDTAIESTVRRSVENFFRSQSRHRFPVYRGYRERVLQNLKSDATFRVISTIGGPRGVEVWGLASWDMRPLLISDAGMFLDQWPDVVNTRASDSRASTVVRLKALLIATNRALSADQFANVLMELDGVRDTRLIPIGGLPKGDKGDEGSPLDYAHAPEPLPDEIIATHQAVSCFRHSLTGQEAELLQRLLQRASGNTATPSFPERGQSPRNLRRYYVSLSRKYRLARAESVSPALFDRELCRLILSDSPATVDRDSR